MMMHAALAPLFPWSTAGSGDMATRLSRGQHVEVKSAREVAATLDSDGKLDGVPFMPEMARYCGRSFRVFRRADVTCVEGYGLRRMAGAVFLDELRCDGSAHDGCQRRCLLFWKEAWLRPAVPVQAAVSPARHPAPGADPLDMLPTRADGRYACQSTALSTATAELSGQKLLPYVWQIRDAEITLARCAQLVARTAANQLRRLVGLSEIGRLTGRRSTSLQRDLRLQPGEWVTVRSRAQIRQTLDAAGRNRGLAFEPEMTGYAGRRFQVAFRIENLIQEESGRMVHPAGTVALSGATCRGLCAKNCPRTHYWFWREDWLDRAPSCGGEGPLVRTAASNPKDSTLQPDIMTKRTTGSACGWVAGLRTVRKAMRVGRFMTSTGPGRAL